ncbi:predicted protein [Postia placenta Mad-698-R]|nr:predicted protein [Postia placenta Mad-698-R]
MEAILRGLRKRHASTGDLPILIHTSGTGVIATPAKGMFASDLIYSDTDVAQIKSIPPPALHRNVDLRFLGGVVGLGKSIWANVHIHDVADLYIVLFDAITANPEGVGHGWEGFYFGENDEHTWYDVGKAISKALVDLGIGGTDEPTELTDEELTRYWGSVDAAVHVGSNLRCRANRGRPIGWKPTYTTADLIASIKPDSRARVAIFCAPERMHLSKQLDLYELSLVVVLVHDNLPCFGGLLQGSDPKLE